MEKAGLSLKMSILIQIKMLVIRNHQAMNMVWMILKKVQTIFILKYILALNN